MSYLTNFFSLCGTNNVCIDSPYDIAHFLRDIGVYFQNRRPKVKIIISGILSRDECYSVNRILIKQIYTISKCKCTFHRFNFVEQEKSWTHNNGTLDPSLFYKDNLHLIQKGNQAIRINYTSYWRPKYWSKHPFQRDGK